MYICNNNNDTYTVHVHKLVCEHGFRRKNSVCCLEYNPERTFSKLRTGAIICNTEIGQLSCLHVYTCTLKFESTCTCMYVCIYIYSSISYYTMYM